MKNDWIEVEIKNIGEIVTGGTPSKTEEEYYNKNDFPFFKPTDLNQGINTFDSNDFLSSSGFLNARKAPKDSILVTCIGATIGKTGLIKREGGFNQQINAIIPFEFMNNRFMFYQIVSREFQNKIRDNSSSTTLPILNKSKFSNLKARLAPLPEQRAIVSKIEELFSELDHSIASFKAAKAKLEIYRQAVLKKAFEGGFTSDKKSVWKIVSFEDATINFDGKRRPLSKTIREKFKGDFPYYGACEIIDYVKEYLFEGEYLLIGEDGANLLTKSKPLAFIAKGKFWVNNHAHVIQPKAWLDIRFLGFQFNSLQINEYVTGTAQPKLNQGNLNKIPLKICDLKEQFKIVQEIETRLSVADKLAETIEINLKKSEALRQSILKKAFEGKLLRETELEACRKEADWEPAEKLLERIKREKQK